MDRRRESSDHILSDTQLDSYLLHSLPEAASELFEDHLLFCRRCQGRVMRRRTIVATVREALTRWPESGSDQLLH